MPLMPQAPQGMPPMPPGHPQGGPPPELLAALMGGGGPDPASGPNDPSGGPGGPDFGGDPVSVLKTLMDGVQAYLQVEPDEEDKAVAAQCFSSFQKLLAKNQQQADAAMGTTPAHKFVRKSAGGSY